MSKIGMLQNALEDLFDECTPQFVNKKHTIQLQYRVKKNKRILVLVRMFRYNPEKALLKSAMYVKDEEDIDFLRAYLSGLVLTLAIEYVTVVIRLCTYQNMSNRLSIHTRSMMMISLNVFFSFCR